MLHPGIVQILNDVATNNFFTNVELFTGGNFPTVLIEPLIRMQSKLKVIFNLNEEHDYLPATALKVHENLRCLVDSGVEAILSYTIYKPNFDFKQHLKYLNEFGIQTLRWSLASPSGSRSNKYLHIIQDKAFGRRLFDFFMECAHLDVDIVADCTVPLCIFSPEMWGELDWFFPSLGRHNPPGSCAAAIDVNTDMTVRRCFGFPGESVHLRDFQNLEELRRYFETSDEKMRWATIPIPCLTCGAARRHACQGGCLGMRPKNNLLKSTLQGEEKNEIVETCIDASSICDRLFQLALNGEYERFQLEWSRVSELPAMIRYPGSFMLRAFRAELDKDIPSAIMNFRKALPHIKQEYRHWVITRIKELSSTSND